MLLKGTRRYLCMLMLAVLIASACLIPTGIQKAAAGTVWQIYLSNNFVGNSQRVEMQKIAAAVALDKPYGAKVQLHIVDSENSDTAQIASLSDIISRHPAAILFDAGSPAALNATVTRACRQGIVMVTFDQIANAPCASKVEVNTYTLAEVNMQWLALTLHGKGKVAYDYGLPGAPISLLTNKAYNDVLAKYPGINVVARYHGDYAAGPAEQALSNILSSNSSINGVVCTAGCLGVVQAYQHAGLPQVPLFNYGDDTVQIINDALTLPHLQMRMADNPPTMGAWALELAYNLLSRKADPTPPTLVHAKGSSIYYLPLRWFQNNNVQVRGYPAVSLRSLLPHLKGIPPTGYYPYSLPNAPVSLQQTFGS